MSTDALWAEFTEQGSAPATPGTGKWRLFFKDDGMYFVADTGDVFGPVPLSALTNPMTATGDVIYSSDGSGTPAALAAGDDDDVLTLASGVPVWAPPAAGGAGMVHIATGTPSGSPGIITFSSIPQTYKDLLVVGRLRCSDATNHRNSVLMRAGNGSLDTGTNYAYFSVTRVASGSVGESHDDNGTEAYAWRGAMPGAASTAGYFGSVRMTIYDYANTSYAKNFVSDYANVPNSTSGEIAAGYGGGAWIGTSAIDVLSFYDEGGDSLVAGSELRLYGLQ